MIAYFGYVLLCTFYQSILRSLWRIADCCAPRDAAAALNDVPDTLMLQMDPSASDGDRRPSSAKSISMKVRYPFSAANLTSPRATPHLTPHLTPHPLPISRRPSPPT